MSPCVVLCVVKSFGYHLIILTEWTEKDVQRVGYSY